MAKCQSVMPLDREHIVPVLSPLLQFGNFYYTKLGKMREDHGRIEDCEGIQPAEGTLGGEPARFGWGARGGGLLLRS